MALKNFLPINFLSLDSFFGFNALYASVINKVGLLIASKTHVFKCLKIKLIMFIVN